MKKVTVEEIMELKPCYDQLEVEKLWGENESLTLLEICQLDIPIDDIIWAVSRLMPKKDARLFACDCAEHVLCLFERDYPDNKRPRDCIEVSRKYANGEVGDAAMDAAWDAAWAAAWAAARAAAGAAAWAAAMAAAGAARDARDAARDARDAAGAAAWAARDADRDAEKQWQLNCLIGYVTE
jgi:hypothetical protein